LVAHYPSSAARNDSPYLTAFKGLAYRLGILDDMNKKLPIALDSQRDKEYSNWIRKLKNEDKQTQTDVVRIVSRMTGNPRHHSVRSSKAGPLVGDLVASILEYEQMSRFIREMSLVYLVSQFEIFLQQMISLTLQKTPGPIMEKSITLKQLTDCKSIKEAKRQIMEKEIHDIKLTNPDEADGYFSRKFRVRLSALPRWSDFRERFYRRHAIIHRSGIPDQKYRVKTGRKRARELDVSKNYLATSIKLFVGTARRIARQLERRFGSEWPQDYL
jgi:hypothetical protein